MTRNPGTIARQLATRFDKDGIGDPFSTPPRLTPAETLGRHLLETVLTTAQVRRFRHAPGLRVVIEAPTPAWVEPLRSAAMTMAAWHIAEGLDGAPGRFPRTAAVEERIAQALAAGHRILAVSHAPGRHIPPSLVAGADMSIRTGRPTPAVIRKAIRDATGVEHGTTSGRLGDRLDFFDLASAIRAGSDVPTCLRKLGNATANRAVSDRFPARAADIDSLNGYGEAAPWASRLVADIDAWRLGEVAELPGHDRLAVLAGPHGTGKSSLVAGIAGTTGLPLVAASVANWFAVEKPVFEGGLRRAEAAFVKAADAAPAILLLDGIDAIPRSEDVEARDADGREAIVGSVGRFLDAITSGEPSSPKLIVVATATLADDVDPELVRPRRLSRIIEIPHPPDEAIPGILRQHLGQDLRGIDLDGVATLASGSTGATIAGWVRAARRRARIDRRAIAIGDLLVEASAPENHSPGSPMRAEVHETFRVVDVEATQPTQARSIPHGAAGGRAGSPGIRFPPAKVIRSGIGIRARFLTVPAEPARGATPGSAGPTDVPGHGKGK